MTSSSESKKPLGERSSNLPSPVKSPSKIPLPPSPARLEEQSYNDSAKARFAEQDGAMSQVFEALTLSQKPALIRKISEAHSSGQTYTSPSDDILSPTTKKLSEAKSKRFGYVVPVVFFVSLAD